VPVYEATAPGMGVHLTWVGKCSTSTESHGYWWKATPGPGPGPPSGPKAEGAKAPNKAAAVAVPVVVAAEEGPRKGLGDHVAEYFGMGPRRCARCALCTPLLGPYLAPI